MGRDHRALVGREIEHRGGDLVGRGVPPKGIMPSNICAASRSWPAARISMSSWKAVEVDGNDAIGPMWPLMPALEAPSDDSASASAASSMPTSRSFAPLGGEPAGGGETDAGLATRDQGDLSRQAHYGVVVDSVNVSVFV